MTKFISFLILLGSSFSNAADFVMSVTPAANSVGDTQVNSLSITKVTNLQSSLNSKADQASVTASLALKADASSLGSLATKSTITNIDVLDGALDISKILNLQTSLNSKADQSSVTSSLALKADQSSVTSALALKADQTTVNSALALKANISSLGSLATKSSITDADLSDGALSPSKITGLGPFATAAYLSPPDIPSLLSSKISDFASAVVSAMSSILSNYLLKSEIQSPIVFRGENSAATLVESGTVTLIPFASNKTDHSNGAMSSDGTTFTCLVSGSYLVNVQLTLNGTGDPSTYAFDNSPGRVFDVYLYKNGLLHSEIAQDRKMYPGQAHYYDARGSDVIDCVVNDVIQIYAKHTISGAAIPIPLLNAGTYNFINIIKIGQF